MQEIINNIIIFKEGKLMLRYLPVRKVAKKIAIARPSIYNALEHMLDKGMVELVPDQTALYTAQEPEVLLRRMQAEMTANLSLARQQLEEYETAKQPEVHFVFRGFETAMARAGKLLEDAREEVYLNADFDLSCFAETFHRLKKKGVRIVAFSFDDLGLHREVVRCICQLERYGQQQWADGENFVGAYSTRYHFLHCRKSMDWKCIEMRSAAV